MTERRRRYYTTTLSTDPDYEPEPLPHEAWYIVYQQCRSLIDGLDADTDGRARVIHLLAMDAHLRVWTPG